MHATSLLVDVMLACKVGLRYITLYIELAGYVDYVNSYLYFQFRVVWLQFCDRIHSFLFNSQNKITYLFRQIQQHIQSYGSLCGCTFCSIPIPSSRQHLSVKVTSSAHYTLWDPIHCVLCNLPLHYSHLHTHSYIQNRRS
jgi:hypothetical protein